MWRRSAMLAVRLVLMIGLVVAGAALPASGRGLDNRYAAPPPRDWFEHLASAKGLCGRFADGYVTPDTNWQTKDGHYRVRLPEAITSNEMVWVDVPNTAVIAEPNKTGRTMVWPLYGHGGVSIRCFMPGGLT
jgi:hypothetical protein